MTSKRIQKNCQIFFTEDIGKLRSEAELLLPTNYSLALGPHCPLEQRLQRDPNLTICYQQLVATDALKALKKVLGESETKTTFGKKIFFKASRAKTEQS